jgi:cytosine/adenosine deaminase-related metal-dependent hydrolase
VRNQGFDGVPEWNAVAQVFAGRLLLSDDVIGEAWVEVEDGRITDLGEGRPPSTPSAEGWIAPRPVNAHTHVADAFLRGQRGMPRSIPELVGPGGWKHRQLAMARRGRMGRGVHAYANEMARLGTTHFLDFRENGSQGVKLLTDLRDGADWARAEGLGELPVQPVILGRPSKHDFDADEAAALLETADGIGLSAMADFPNREDVRAWAEATHRADVPLALHVSEDRHEDLAEALALDPAFVVHMVHGHAAEFKALADRDIPVVVCPRSNRFFGNKTPIRALVHAGCHVAIGTDNGMLQDGDLLQELALLRQWDPGLPEELLLRMLTFGGRALIGDLAWPPEPGHPAPAVLASVPMYALA